jgi:hypothetical protein
MRFSLKGAIAEHRPQPVPTPRRPFAAISRSGFLVSGQHLTGAPTRIGNDLPRFLKIT